MQGREQRMTTRFKLPPMYTLLRARLEGVHDPDRTLGYAWTGHVYDISTSGMRFELDQSVPAGTRLEVRVMLPGHGHHAFRAVGNVVRLHDEESDFGPMRMGMTFDRFETETDQQVLADYLGHSQLQAA